MKDNRKTLTSSEVEQLFEDGSIIVFKCEPSFAYPTTFVSKNVEKILGFNRDYFLTTPNAWSGRIHPDDRERVSTSFHNILENGGAAINEYRFKRKDGRMVWLRDEIKLLYNESGEPSSILGTSFEITDRKISELEAQREIENELRNRLNFQNALSLCSNLLVDASEISVFDEVLKILQRTTGSGRVYFFTNKTTPEGELLVSQKFEACAEGVIPEIDNPELQNIPYKEFPFFYQRLKSNLIVNKPTEELPSPEKELMQAQKISSVLLLPVFQGDDWFGFIGFDSLTEARSWEQYELLTLRTTVEIIGNFLKRISMKESLIQQRNFTQQILDNLPSILTVVDRKMNLLLWNKTGEKLTGYSADELKNMSAFDFVPKEDHKELIGAMKKILAHNTAGQEVNVQHKRGMISPYFWRGNIIEMDGKEVFLLVGLNISKQKEMERELIEEKRFADAIIDGLPGTFFMLDENLNLVRANKNLAQDIGYSVEELLNQKILNYFSTDDKQQLGSRLKELFEKGKVSLETSPVSKDGNELTRNVNAVLFERGGETFIIGTGQDISDLKKRERELRASIHEKEVLLQEIHHRVKNNLAVISGLLELQVHEYSDPTFSRLIQESQMRIQTMAMIHEKLYRSESLSRIFIHEYIDDLIDQIRSSIKIGNAEISVNTEIEDVELNINQAIPFALALNEIISNSLEHAFKGKDQGKVTVKLEERDGVIYSTIKDDGVGFSTEEDLSTFNSLGMTLIKSLLSQIEAEWTIDGKGGVTYRIEFRKDMEKGSSSSLDII
ncbi:MAG: PAS domain S-box protein [Gracilimonas sp.]|uniref:PAS domain S-box protein n=1 Tax=Gracilimonas TaxID=649462 RepID=UPI001B1E7ADC|nr:PAS domain S-box protein [Gracilimonas sp.]MBO6587055.1 PAS domain S-box protein [Gracilimonas sp.]MBO6614457.1 PAS domain S-box protein [Gracilimonas sp.]